MRIAELQRILSGVDEAAVLVTPQVLEGVLREVYPPPVLAWSSPHTHCCVVPRQLLFRHVEQDELDLKTDEVLPDTVKLLVRPSREELAETSNEALLHKYWRLLFHAHIHRSMEALSRTEEQWRERVHQLGASEFAEIRAVLVEDDLLPENATDRQAFIEFAAYYWELYSFAPDMLPAFFPSILDWHRVHALLSEDLDAASILRQTRLPGSPEPGKPPHAQTDESHEFYYRLMQQSDDSAHRGNLVKALILQRRALRVAPSDQLESTRKKNDVNLNALIGRLQTALVMSDAESASWHQILPTLLDKADQGRAPVEASLLYDLQKVCLDYEQEIYALDVVEWALSAGRRPIKRPLPGQQLVRITKHLRSAQARVSDCRLSDGDRQFLSTLLQLQGKRCQERVRARFRPILTTALLDVGLTPRYPPEKIAFEKMIEELLSLIVHNGFFTFSELRDVISRNQLKLPDLERPEDFIKGDPLLRLDRRLGNLLDGVYRPSEVYMRVLERFTALNFGTGLGRWLTLNVWLPFGGAFLIVQLLLHLRHQIHSLLGTPPETIRVIPTWLEWTLTGATGLFLYGLIHFPRFRERVGDAAKKSLKPIRFVVRDLPIEVVQHPAVQTVVKSWAFQIFLWLGLQPLALCAVLVYFWPDLLSSWTSTLGLFLLTVVVLNSRVGEAAVALLAKGFFHLVDLIRVEVLIGLYHFIVWAFAQIHHLFEAALFSVDEFLRFRSGEDTGSMVIRAIMNFVWYPVSYFFRFYLVVLVEPMFHPLKYPITSLGYKFMLPFVPELNAFFTGLFVPILGPYIGYGFALLTVFLLPDALGFLFWEMKENWSLYRVNRSRWLNPSVMGPHGETVRGLLRPGFHSGTVPKLFAKLRVANRTAYETGNSRHLRNLQDRLEEVAQSIRFFALYEFVEILHQAQSWKGLRLTVEHVHLATRRIRIEFALNQYEEDGPLVIDFEERHGWLTGRISRRGWLDRLSAEQREACNTALAGFYKRAGVQIVWEMWGQKLPDSIAGLDLAPEALVAWSDPDRRHTAHYDLTSPFGPMQPVTAEATVSWPVLSPEEVLFNRVPLAWDEIVASWRSDFEERGHPTLRIAGQSLDVLGNHRPAPVPPPPMETPPMVRT